MGTTVARNAPCPCGSGKKHKNCCLGKIAPQTKKRFSILGVIVVVVAVVVGILVGMSYDMTYGIASGAAIGMLGVVVGFFVNPPPSAGKPGDPGAINFGR